MKLPKQEDFTPEQWKIYNSLSNARRRCEDKKNNRYYCYGAKGVKYRLEEEKSRIQLVLEQTEAYMKVQKENPNEVITINRIDINGDYTEDNIEWVTRAENIKTKGDVFPVRCITTGKKYDNAHEAQRETGIWQQNISKCCKGERNCAGKTLDGKPRVWRYAQ